MCVTICGRFCSDEGAVAGYGNRIRAKYTAKWGVQIAGMIFQTRSSTGWPARWEKYSCIRQKTAAAYCFMLRQFFITCPIIKNLFIPLVFLYIECYFDIQKHFSLYYVVFMIRFVELSFVLQNVFPTYSSAENWPGTGFRLPQTYRCRRFSRTAF